MLWYTDMGRVEHIGAKNSRAITGFSAAQPPISAAIQTQVNALRMDFPALCGVYIEFSIAAYECDHAFQWSSIGIPFAPLYGIRAETVAPPKQKGHP